MLDMEAQYTKSLADKDMQLEQQKFEAERAMTALSEEADSRIAALMGQVEEAQEATRQLQEKLKSTTAENQRKEDSLQGMRRDALQREAQLNELRDEMHGKGEAQANKRSIPSHSSVAACCLLGSVSADIA